MPPIETTIALLIVAGLIGYLLGSIPFGMVLTKAMNLGNLREIGSGNIGATNVLRTGSKKAAALTLLLDGGKGAVAVLLGRFVLGEDAAQVMGLAAMLGHCFPVWLRFKGGKGVATFLGIMLALAWPVGLATCTAWLVGAGISRMSSMGAIVSAVAATFLAGFLGYGSAFFLTTFLAILVVLRHSENIKRINAGTEPKIGQKK